MNIEYIINSCLDSIKELYQFEFHVFDMRGMREKDLNLLSVLSEKELEYLDTLKNVKNRIQWISGRYAVKTALFKYKLDRGALMDLSCIDVLKEKDSSPSIIQYPELCVSITHSYPYCIGVVANNKIGIDLEKISEIKESLIRHFYSEKEQMLLESLKDTNEYSKQAMIFWTRKEAVSKVYRLGMQMDFKKLCTMTEIVDKEYFPICIKSFICKDYALSIATAS